MLTQLPVAIYMPSGTHDIGDTSQFRPPLVDKSTAGSNMSFESAIKQLKVVFQGHPLADLTHELNKAEGNIEQASSNIVAKSSASPTKPKARPQVLHQFTDLFPRETSHKDTLVSTVSSTPQTMPWVNYCGQHCQAMKGHKCLYRTWWPKPHFPAYTPMPTTALQLQREHSSRLKSTSADPSGSSTSGTHRLTPHCQTSRPEAESMTPPLPEFMQILISTPPTTYQTPQGQACAAQQQVAEDLGQLALTPPSSDSDLSWEVTSPTTESTPSSHLAFLFNGAVPPDAERKLEDMKSCFPNLAEKILANSLQQHQYDGDAAGRFCLSLLTVEGGDPDWESSGSERGGSSVTTDSIADLEAFAIVDPAVHKFWPPDDSEKLQALDFDKKLARLYDQFSRVPKNVIQHHLSAAEGNYDTAVALLYQMLEASQKEEAERKHREAADMEMALKLEEQINASSGNNAAHSKVQSHWSIASTVEASNAFDKQHPEMKASLEDLIRMYPAVPLDCLQNIIVLASGSIAAASKIMEEQGMSPSPAKPQTGPGPSRLHRTSTADNPPQWPSTSGDYTPPPPGLEFRPPQAVPYAAKNKPRHASRRGTHTDIYLDARQAFRDAQAKIHSSRQSFYNAQIAGDRAAQRHWTSQIEYWQQQAVQEKQKAHKKIFSNKNAEVSNAFQVDLHALHVDEALYSLEGTIKDLQRFKCTWMVEVITGKGLHSTGKDPKLLPAVKAYLRDRDLDCWETPGKVVFKIFPSAGGEY